MESKIIAAIAVFSALSIALVFSPAKFPAPYAPFLKYQIWEIPIVSAFLLYGPLVGTVVSILNTIILLIVYPGDLPTGPLYNLAAILSMLLGIYIIQRFFQKRLAIHRQVSVTVDQLIAFALGAVSFVLFCYELILYALIQTLFFSLLFTFSFLFLLWLKTGTQYLTRRQETRLTVFSTILGSIVRVGVMSVVNWVFLRYPYPIGFELPVDGLVAMLPVIGLFNATVVLYTIPLGYLVSRAVSFGTGTVRWSQR